MQARFMDDKNIKLSLGLSPAEPLWKVAPTRDADGNRVSDLLMIIPRLKTKPKEHIQKTLSEIELVLKKFRHLVIFANVDMKLNTLWVSFKAKPGLFVEITTSLKLHVPEAVIVGDMSSRLTK
jgi:hypothetical protein